MVGSAVWRALESKGYSNLIGKTSAELDLRNQQAVTDFYKKEQPEVSTFVLENQTNKLEGKIFVVSGVFHQLSRNELKKAIEDNGGKISAGISKKTTYVVAGDKMGPSKKTKAEDLGVTIISEHDFIEMIK